MSLSRFGDIDRHLFNEGTHPRLYEHFGAHSARVGGTDGSTFGVWAPNAERVFVIGDFNQWQETDGLQNSGQSGIWEGFVPGAKPGSRYKFRIYSRHNGYCVEKADPFAFQAEEPPRTASVVNALDYSWSDSDWMKGRAAANSLAAPVSTYELHLGSWMRVPEEGNRVLTYRELAPRLVEYLKAHHFTHVELMPVMEHPFFGSWGYQVTGYFAATSRYGKPEDLMFMIDQLHQNGIGVILDWAPAHFPTDELGLIYFDGTHLYEHADPRQGMHAEWGSAVFNFGRLEVRSFLISSALFWLDKFHADGLRVDAVTSLLYLNYARGDNWIPNQYGGQENLEAIEFIKLCNWHVYDEFPDVQMIAEESTAWPKVSRPTYDGGLGFGQKWDLGWMHDTLAYFSKDPIHRKHHHGLLTFRGVYAYTENFVLPLCHDEVVHGKGSLIDKMPGDEWQKFANLRALYGYQWSQPGKKLLFQGDEFGQWQEWSHDRSIDWHLTEHSGYHAQLSHLVAQLNRVYRENPALYLGDSEPFGFEWVEANDAEHSVFAYLRKGPGNEPPILIVLNLTPVPRDPYRVGVPRGGAWDEILNTDSSEFGGSGQFSNGTRYTSPVHSQGHAQSLELSLPPLGVLFLRPRH
ncbi:MAG: 1,4-alpha-glucan branching protein GlgB [Polyangiaceae bacterium]